MAYTDDPRLRASLEVYITAFAQPLHERDDPATDTQRIDLGP